MEANDDDFCDRLPGQHTGRLSLELQASEAAEWQERIDMLARRVRYLKSEMEALKTPPATPSAAVGASEPGAGDIQRMEFLESRIKQQGRQITELIDQNDAKDDIIATKDAALRNLLNENDRLTKLNHHLREVCVMAIVERVPDDTEESDWNRRQQIRKAVREYSVNTTPVYDSKPTNVHNSESEDTPPHNPVLGPVVGTAKVSLRDWCQKSSGTQFPEPVPAESPDD